MPTVPAEGIVHGSVAAAPVEPQTPTVNPREVLSFRLGSEEYGINILRVQEVRSFETCTHLANTPAFNGNVQAEHITGVATVENGDARRMLILLDIERLMTGFDMSLFERARH